MGFYQPIRWGFKALYTTLTALLKNTDYWYSGMDLRKYVGIVFVYLLNRKQFTRIEGVHSSTQNVNIGVPQGSCLGPLLFLIYINNLPYSVKNAKFSIYADDSNLALQSENISQLTAALTHTSLNVVKTQSLFISTKLRQAVMKGQEVTLALDIGDANPETK